VPGNVRLLDMFLREVVGGARDPGRQLDGRASSRPCTPRPGGHGRRAGPDDPALPLRRAGRTRPWPACSLTYLVPGLGEFADADDAVAVNAEQAVRRIINLCFAEPTGWTHGCCRGDELVKGACRAARQRGVVPAGHPVADVHLARADANRAMLRRIDVPVC